MKKARNMIKSSAVALITLLLPGYLLASPIIVRISDLRYPNPPEVEVDGAPNGWSFCTCANLGTIDPANEDGGVITLFGVDTYGSINEPGECGWRFLDPSIPQPTCPSAVDIVWIQHASTDRFTRAIFRSPSTARSRAIFIGTLPLVRQAALMLALGR